MVSEPEVSGEIAAATKFGSLVGITASALWDFAYPDAWEPGIDESPVEEQEQAMAGARAVLEAIEAAGYRIVKRGVPGLLHEVERLHIEIKRLRALTEGDPTSIYHEAAAMRALLREVRLDEGCQENDDWMSRIDALEAPPTDSSGVPNG